MRERQTEREVERYGMRRAGMEAGTPGMCRTRQAGHSGKHWHHSWDPEAVQKQNPLFLGTSRCFLLRPSVGWMRPRHMVEHHLFSPSLLI